MTGLAGIIGSLIIEKSGLGAPLELDLEVLDRAEDLIELALDNVQLALDLVKGRILLELDELEVAVGRVGALLREGGGCLHLECGVAEGDHVSDDGVASVEEVSVVPEVLEGHLLPLERVEGCEVLVGNAGRDDLHMLHDETVQPREELPRGELDPAAAGVGDDGHSADCQTGLHEGHSAVLDGSQLTRVLFEEQPVLGLVDGMQVGRGEQGVVPVEHNQVLALSWLLQRVQPNPLFREALEVPHPHVTVLGPHLKVKLLQASGALLLAILRA